MGQPQHAMHRTVKRCPRCCPPDVELPIDRFGPNRARYDGVQPYCAACMSDATDASHARDGARRRAWVRSRTARVREENRARMMAFLSQQSCADCGERDPVVLEFDHRDGAEKTRDVCLLVGGGYSWERVVAEMVKCDIVCANCHRRRTAARATHYRVRMQKPA